MATAIFRSAKRSSWRTCIQGQTIRALINTIRFDPALTASGPATILLTMGDLTISHAVTIVGPGANLLTVDARGNDNTPEKVGGDGSRIFTIKGDNLLSFIDVSISGLTLTGGDVAQGGAINANFADLLLTGMTISGNAVTSVGGGVYATTCDLTVNQSTISGNLAMFGRGSGGGIYFTGSSARSIRTLQIVGSEISGNTSTFSGAGVAAFLGAGAVDIEDSNITGNSVTTAGGSGGGLYVLGTGSPITVTITNSSLDHNAAGANGNGGGAVFKKCNDCSQQ